MEALGAVFQNVSQHYNSEDTSAFLVSLLFGLGPLLGGNLLVAFSLAFRLQHTLLTSLASGIAIVLGAWRPLQLLLSSKMGFLPLIFLLALGSAFVHVTCSSVLRLTGQKRSSANTSSAATGFSVSTLTLQSILCCAAVALHAMAEGLALGAAAPKAYGLGRHMVLPVFLHGLPRRAAVASCIYGATDSWYGASTRDFLLVRQEWASIRIQIAFWAFLARQALRALIALVRLQAIVRGRQVRKQVIMTLKW